MSEPQGLKSQPKTFYISPVQWGGLFMTASSVAVLYVAFFSCCCCCSWLFLPSLFVQFWLVQSPIGLLVFLSASVLFQTILSNARLDRSKLDEKGHKVVKSPTAIASRDQLNSAQFRVFVGYFSRPLSSSFDLSNFPLDCWYFCLFLFYSKQFCPMLD